MRECPTVRAIMLDYAMSDVARDFENAIPDCRKLNSKKAVKGTRKTVDPCGYCERSLSKILWLLLNETPSTHFHHIANKSCSDGGCVCSRLRKESSRGSYYSYRRTRDDYFELGPGTNLFEPRDALASNANLLLLNFLCLECVKFNCDSKDCLGQGCECEKDHHANDLRACFGQEEIEEVDNDSDDDTTIISSESSD
jgi:hypothetical protein